MRFRPCCAISCARLAHGWSRSQGRAAEAFRDASNAALWPADRAERDRNVAIAQARLNEATFATACAAGQAMTLEQPIGYALSEDA